VETDRSNEAARWARGLFCLLACVSIALFVAASCAEERGERQRTEPRTPQRTEPPTRQRDELRTYRLDGRLTQKSRAIIDKAGATIGEVGKRYAVVTATRREIRDIAGAGFFTIQEQADGNLSAEGRARRRGFPPEDSAYHDYAEMSAEVRDEVIASETERNREAVLYIAEQADCPYRSIGKEAQHCASVPPR